MTQEPNKVLLYAMVKELTDFVKFYPAELIPKKKLNAEVKKLKKKFFLPNKYVQKELDIFDQ